MKSTITQKIIISYLIIIFVSLAFNAAFFSLAAKRFTESQVTNNMEKTADAIRKILREDINFLRKDIPSEGYTVETNKVLQGINSILRRSVFIQGSSYAILNKDQKIIYPSMRMSDDFDKFKLQILPMLKDSSGNIKENNLKFRTENEEYIAVVLPVAIRIDNTVGIGGWIILYTVIDQVNALRKGLLDILPWSLFFSAVMAVTVGIFIARSVAKPVVKLKRRAELLSQRDFDTRVDINTGDEIQQLAQTFNKVASELKDYDMGQKKFLQNASHELKTPLMSIQGYAEGLKDGVFEDREHALDVIIEESNRLKKIVEELIFLSKLETMESYYNCTPESVNELIEKSVEKVASIAIKNGIEIILHLNTDATIYVDNDKFTQALINLLGNCLRYGNKETHIAAAIDEKNCEIRIFDDGEGFDEMDLKNIFERFYKGKKGNTGLGLAITRVIIEKHGGSIEAYNNAKGGAEFRVLLPVLQNPT